MLFACHCLSVLTSKHGLCAWPRHALTHRSDLHNTERCRQGDCQFNTVGKLKTRTIPHFIKNKYGRCFEGVKAGHVPGNTDACSV